MSVWYHEKRSRIEKTADRTQKTQRNPGSQKRREKKNALGKDSPPDTVWKRTRENQGFDRGMTESHRASLQWSLNRRSYGNQYFSGTWFWHKNHKTRRRNHPMRDERSLNQGTVSPNRATTQRDIGQRHPHYRSRRNRVWRRTERNGYAQSLSDLSRDTEFIRTKLRCRSVPSEKSHFEEFLNKIAPQKWGYFWFFLVTLRRVVHQMPETAPGQKPNRWLSKIVSRFYPPIQLSGIKYHKKQNSPTKVRLFLIFFGDAGTPLDWSFVDDLMKGKEEIERIVESLSLILS